MNEKLGTKCRHYDFYQWLFVVYFLFNSFYLYYVHCTHFQHYLYFLSYIWITSICYSSRDQRIHQAKPKQLIDWGQVIWIDVHKFILMDVHLWNWLNDIDIDIGNRIIDKEWDKVKVKYLLLWLSIPI